jgi:hypothetical protein
MRAFTDEAYRAAIWRDHQRRWGPLIHPDPAPQPAAEFERAPDAMLNEDAYNRFHHFDLPDLNARRRWAEMRRIEYTLARQERPHPWLSERLQQLYQERGRRRKGASR